MKKALTLSLMLCISAMLKSQDSIVLVKKYNDFFFPTNHTSMSDFNSKLIHPGQSSSFGNNLWQTDGTTVNTSTFLATSSLITGYTPSAIVSVLGKLFFVSKFNSNKSLYVTDGTSIGTVKLCNIGSIISENMLINPKVANGKLFFTKDSTATGAELWATDGTLAGTQMVKDIAVGNSSGVSKAFCAVFGNKFYFVANNIANGEELWVTDGTSANTQMVYDLHNGTSSTNFTSNFFVFNSHLYFTATVSGFKYGLYKTDGTVGVMPTLETGNLTLTSNAVVHQNAILFGATTYTPTTYSPFGDLYSISTSTPNMVGDLSYNDAVLGTVKGTNAILGTNGNDLFLSVNTTNLGTELWGYSVANNTVTLLKDIATGTLSGIDNSNFDYDIWFTNKKTVLGNKFVFVAQSRSNGVTSGNGSHQEEIWTSDGTTAGTNKAISTYSLFTFTDYAYNSMTIFNGDVYFYGSTSASSSSDATLWKLKLGIASSIKDNVKESIDLVVYPNPVKDILNLKFHLLSTEPTFIRITNILGEEVLTETITSGNFALKTNSFRSGVYFVTVTNKNNQSTKKFIIE